MSDAALHARLALAPTREPWPERVMSDLACCPRCAHRAPRVGLGGSTARHWTIECPQCGERIAATDSQGLGVAVSRWNRAR
jgi:hypothetical protein